MNYSKIITILRIPVCILFLTSFLLSIKQGNTFLIIGSGIFFVLILFDLVKSFLIKKHKKAVPKK